MELTGENINQAQGSQDQQTKLPIVSLALDSSGSSTFADLTTANKGKIMAMVLIDQGKAEVVTAPRINEPITGGRVQITGMASLAEANDVALLLRAGSLAAPMKIIEERTIGPSLGAEKHQQRHPFHRLGLCGRYRVHELCITAWFGIFSAISLSANLLFLFAIFIRPASHAHAAGHRRDGIDARHGD